MRDISFQKNKFEAIVILNSEIGGYAVNQKIVEIINMLSEAILIVADGAFNAVVNLGIGPDIVIGDMDSIDWDLFYKYNTQNEKKIKAIKIEEQETNDFEKCLNYLFANNYKNILILGIGGGLLEHSLNNWSVFIKFSRKLNLCNWENDRYSFSLTKESVIHLEVGETVSVIPQSLHRITTENLKWELKDELLGLGLREGARNVVLKSPIKIKSDKGSVLFFCDARLPFCP